ncbi:MAG: hypothetical protein AVDCRST_MAG23-1408, partial [uncultured Sphingosinicella sp.]
GTGLDMAPCGARDTGCVRACRRRRARLLPQSRRRSRRLCSRFRGMQRTGRRRARGADERLFAQHGGDGRGLLLRAFLRREHAARHDQQRPARLHGGQGLSPRRSVGCGRKKLEEVEGGGARRTAVHARHRARTRRKGVAAM